METTARGAKKVTLADSAKAFREAISVNADLLAAPLLIASHAANFAGKIGELALITATATDTLPAASANALHGVTTTAGTTTITASGGAKIYGDFINAASSITLLANQHVILQSDGTNWFIVAGEPKWEQAYKAAETFTKAELEAGVVFSTTRSVFVVWGTGSLKDSVSVGGVAMVLNTVFLVPPGQVFKAATIEASAKCNVLSL